jgi:predicted Fe-Mo cluster-binding NifX family protein
MSREGETMRVCLPVTADGQVGPTWGRAERVALAEVVDGRILDWQEVDVGWGSLHDAGTEGSHHARVAAFIRQERVEGVAAAHMGQPMQTMLGKMGVHLMLSAAGEARAAARAVERWPAAQP